MRKNYNPLPLYRAWLHLYPASFRAEYEREMCAIFSRRWRDSEGFLARIELCADASIEILWHAAAVHADILRQDLRVTARALKNAPGFALTMILVLALGIGANTAAFSITDHLLVRPLPFRDSERLLKLWEDLPGYPRMDVSPANYRDWKRMSRSFEAIAAMRDLSVNLVGEGAPVHVEGKAVTADLFPLLGRQPALGRVFTSADDRESASGTVVLSHRLWQAVFAGDPNVLGRTVRLDDHTYTIIGVMPRDFYFPTREAEFWTAMRFLPIEFVDRANNYLHVVARLKPGVSFSTAQAEMRLIAAQLERAFPKQNQHTGATVTRLRDELSDYWRLMLWALCGAAFCVLLIACANLANLQLGRALMRRRELAVRTALGAGRERLVRQLLTESLTLTIFGGLLGVFLGVSAMPLLARLVPDRLPLAEIPSLDPRVFGIALVLTGITAAGIGIIPAWRACRRADFTELREGTRTAGGPRERLRSALVVAEVAATVVLLVGSGLFLRALWNLESINPGFNPDGVLTLRTVLPMPKYDETATNTAFYSRVLSEVRALPRVSSAAYISFLPMTGAAGLWPVSVNGRLQEVRAAGDVASLLFITPGYFDTLRIPIRQGRDVSESDTRDRPLSAVVSQSFVERYWPGNNPLGRRFKLASFEWHVVGVVGNVRNRGFEQSSEPQVYLPYRQAPDAGLDWYAPKDLAIRSSANPAELLPAIRRIIAAVDPELPVSDVQPMSEIVAAETASRALQLRVLGAFAILAFLLAAVGIHGVLSFAVSQRAREIGVRVALGAKPRDILGMILRRGLILASSGVVPGLLIAYACGSGLRALLAGVQPGDASTFLSAAALCLLMTLAGSLWPALRAIRVDPMTVIRAE